MKKVLISILIILLIVMAYFAIFKGISIGSFKILSVEQIEQENDKLTQEIAQTETLMHSNYSAKTEELEKSVTSMLNAKSEYLDLAEVSTEGEIKAASKQETYKIEYLWTRIGSHATGEGVILKLDVTSGDTGEANVKNLVFTVTGNYIAIINFVSSIEDDSQLAFRIENFKILPGTGTDGRQATFTVRNIRVKQESTTANVSTSTNRTDNASQGNNTADADEGTINDANTNTVQTDNNTNQENAQ